MRRRAKVGGGGEGERGRRILPLSGGSFPSPAARSLLTLGHQSPGEKARCELASQFRPGLSIGCERRGAGVNDSAGEGRRRREESLERRQMQEPETKRLRPKRGEAVQEEREEASRGFKGERE